MNKYVKELISALKSDEVNEDIVMEYSDKLQELESIYKNKNILEDYKWNEEVSEYIEKLGKVKNIFNVFEFSTDIDFLKEKIEKFEQKSKKEVVNIVVLSNDKGYSSSLISGLVNFELEDLVVNTKIVLSNNGKNYIKTKFYTEEEWNENIKNFNNQIFLKEKDYKKVVKDKSFYLNREEERKEFLDFMEFRKEIEKLTLEDHSLEYFIKEVEIGLVNDNISENVRYILIPSFNVNDDNKIKYNEKYLLEADCVLFSVNESGFNEVSVKLFSIILNKTRNFNNIFVLISGIFDESFCYDSNNIDNIRREIYEYLNDKFNENEYNISFDKIMFTFPRLQVLLENYRDNIIKENKLYEILKKQGYDLKTRELKEVHNERLEEKFEDWDAIYLKLKQYSNIKKLREKINNEIIKVKEKEQVKKLKDSYKELKEEIMGKMVSDLAIIDNL